ncbi:MAG: LPS assembly lipoprotein LptE [Halomonas sp.]|nr:LPS assembly lipoprotein LptE [Halomonas sp.]MDN6296431.1 LPS assembly lipoprotein LptE [Halomonas sp.]MDN6313784.1 LPS assembly lipoprotein LptE [Halomonas sp.]MDN6335238.1 LPS assembly lipoprotein LptE [Halomonas sp.]
MNPQRSDRRAFLGVALTASAAALLSGCGFQLRGRDSLPTLPAFALEGDTQGELGQALTRLLHTRGSDIRDDAPWRLTLSSVEMHNRRLGGDGRGSREHEFTLEARVSLQQRADQAYVWNRKSISTTTRLRVNDDDLLNRDVLIEEARQQLARELATRIIEHLASVEALR